MTGLVAVQVPDGVRLAKGLWCRVVDAAGLARMIAVYAGLWARGAKGPGLPGPWAEFYEADLRVMRRALADLTGGNHDVRRAG